MAESDGASLELREQVVSAVVVAEEAEKDKKKKRRQNRRLKKSIGATPGGVSNSFDGVCRPTPVWLENGCDGVLNASPVRGFSSLPIMNISGNDGLLRPIVGSSPPEMKVSRSCLLPASSSHICFPLKKYFPRYWSEGAVDEAIKSGRAFKALFRVNAHNRLEAYCTIDGLPVDVLINGVAAQNRAIEGDVVALVLDPVASWTKLRGSNMPGNSNPHEDSNMISEVREVAGYNYDRKENFAVESEFLSSSNNGFTLDRESVCPGKSSGSAVLHSGPGTGVEPSNERCNGQNFSSLDGEDGGLASDQDAAVRALERICAMASSYPFKRPTGKVISIIKKSARRGAVVGFLRANQWLSEEGVYDKQICNQIHEKYRSAAFPAYREYIELVPNYPKFPKMDVKVSSLPDIIIERLKNGDATVGKELVAACIAVWSEESLNPQANILHVLGRGGQIKPQIDAILFENSICSSSFSSESLACLPDVPWAIPSEELGTRRDLRNICTFTIDPLTAIDLDDALSVEVVSDDMYRIGVHIADVTYFVSPGTALDREAQVQSTSVYMLQHKLPMLPPKLSEDVGSLVPGVDRLALSIIWDINHNGNVVARWIGHSVIQSCCKLSYDLVQLMIDGSLDVDQLNMPGSSIPQLHGNFEWKDVLKSVCSLHEISMKLKDSRFKDGAISLENVKLMFSFDELGTPYDSYFHERKESCSLVEEFMLLANMSIAEIISRAFPDCALLRRHPEPNLRKLKEFEAFCCKHGFEIDTSSSRQFHLSLSKMREKLHGDPILFYILIAYASKPMQSAMYFCTGDLRGLQNEWAHYALSVPFYTHFTSPLRRYPDILVHRTLCAILDAEEMYLNQKRNLLGNTESEDISNTMGTGCFTGLSFDKNAAESIEGKQALKAAAFRFQVPGTELLVEHAAYCNERKLASRHAEEASAKLYLWALLKKKEFLVSEARVLGLGPKFMSVYIQKLAIDRRIYYDDVDALAVEWFETTSTLLLDLAKVKPFCRRGNPVKSCAIEDMAVLMDPSVAFSPEEEIDASQEGQTGSTSSHAGLNEKDQIDPAFFPLTLRLLSSVPVVLHAVGGDDGPLDIGVRLYMCSYLTEAKTN